MVRPLRGRPCMGKVICKGNETGTGNPSKNAKPPVAAERNTGGGGGEAKVDTEADADARCKDGDGCRGRIRIQSLLVEFL